jgi:hypothetical protein
MLQPNRSSQSGGRSSIGGVDAVMSWLGVFEQRHQAIGAAMIDATQPLPQVVDAVLAAASTVP